MRIGIVAGEASGDLLATGLIRAIKLHYPDAVFEGIAGPQMIEAGCLALYPAERLAVMGLVEVLGRYRELSAIRRNLIDYFTANPPDVFIGVDAPDFNLGLERALKQAAIPTVHYVSPSVWAWRQRRIAKIAASVDLILTLFPFEAAFYQAHDVPVRFVGHPLADMIPMHSDAQAARRVLGLPEQAKVIALLPGSRVGEVQKLAECFIQTAQWCATQCSDLHVVVPLVNESTQRVFEDALRRQQATFPFTLLQGQSREAMAAADVVLLASGTATLEALLLKRPMVVAYRMAAVTAFLARRMLKVPYVSLPNLLAGRAVVEEYLQQDAVPSRLGPAVMKYLDQPERALQLQSVFEDIHRTLCQDANQAAAAAVLSMVGHATAQ